MSDHIDEGLTRLQQSFRKQPDERMTLYAQVLRRHRLTESEMSDAVVQAFEHCEFFPSVKKLLEYARPAGVNLPRRDDGARPYDAIADLEAQITVCLAWARQFEERGDTYRRDQIEKDIRRYQDHIDRRLQERGLAPRYAGNTGAELWTGQL